ncbi:thiol-disulfide oxidoreductase DCC family protein [Aquimarina sp. AD10]|nr:thiol-disulfide oxidoreductase DCC family protein [Aquimarina sp. AD10]RKM97598.1 DUF393 domain-containing protein [Aquimarina sp. AD10]
MTGLLFLSFFDIEKLWTPNKKVQSTIYTTDLIIEKNHKPIIFFDGICNLCNTWIQFILKKEKYPYFKFASLQSEMAKVILKDHKISKDITTIVLIKDEKIYHKSDAILHICKHLNYPWYLGKWFLIVPKSLRDFVYNIIAKNRYKWFGKQKQCALMTSDQKLRFLDL